MTKAKERLPKRVDIDDCLRELAAGVIHETEFYAEPAYGVMGGRSARVKFC